MLNKKLLNCVHDEALYEIALVRVMLTPPISRPHSIRWPYGEIMLSEGLLQADDNHCPSWPENGL